MYIHKHPYVPSHSYIQGEIVEAHVLYNEDVIDRKFQCVAECCRVLQSFLECWSVAVLLQCVYDEDVIDCNLQFVVVSCSVLMIFSL